MGRPRRFHAFPAAVAAYPVAYLAALFPLNASGDELAIVTLALLAAGATVYAAAYLSLRRRAAPTLIAVVAAAANAFLFCAPMVADRLPFGRQRLTLPLLALLFAAGCLWLLRRRAPGRTAARGVAAFVYVLLFAAAVQQWTTRGRVRRSAEDAAAALALDRPLTLRVPDAGRAPDIYVLVVDGLANEAALGAFKHASIEAFADTLRALGFVLPAVWSNYPWTAHSVASLLNAAQMRGVPEHIPRGLWEDGVYFRLIQGSRVPRALAAVGYRVYVGPAVGFAGTGRLDVPHTRLGPRGLDRLRAAFAAQTMGAVALYLTVPGRVMVLRGQSYQAPRLHMKQFGAVRELIGVPGPKLVLVHTLLTHDPFLLDRSCEPRRREAPPDSQAAAYVEHVHCAARELTSLVSEILHRSPSPPAIVIQGDHGSWPSGFTIDRPRAKLSEAELVERFGAFGAYYLPGDGARAMPSPVSPVNVLRFVLDHYLGAELPAVPNEAFYAPRGSAEPFASVDTMPFVRFHAGRGVAAGREVAVRR